MRWRWMGVLLVFLTTPAKAFDLPVRKLGLLDNLSKAAERGDAERFRAYLRLLEDERSAFEKTFAVALPETSSTERLPDIKGALLAGWAVLLAGSLARQPDAPDSEWRVVTLMLSSNKAFIDQGGPDLYDKFQQAVAELRLSAEGPARRALYADLELRVGKLIAQTLNP